MSNIKSKITINGNTFLLKDEHAISYFEEMDIPSDNQSIAKKNIGLENADNTSDANKPISTAQAAALALKAEKADTPVKSDIAIIVNGDTTSMPVPVGGYAFIKNNTHSLLDGLYYNKSSSPYTSGMTANNVVFAPVSGGALNELLPPKIRYGSVGMNEMSDITLAGGAGRYTDITFDGFTNPPVVLATFRNDGYTTYGNLAVAVSSVTKTSARLLVPYPLNGSNAGVYWMAIGQ